MRFTAPQRKLGIYGVTGLFLYFCIFRLRFYHASAMAITFVTKRNWGGPAPLLAGSIRAAITLALKLPPLPSWKLERASDWLGHVTSVRSNLQHVGPELFFNFCKSWKIRKKQTKRGVLESSAFSRHTSQPISRALKFRARTPKHTTFS